MVKPIKISDIKIKNNRNISIELLRVISMLLIVSQHFMENTGIIANTAIGNSVYF